MKFLANPVFPYSPTQKSYHFAFPQQQRVGGQKQVYSCEYTKHSLFSYILNIVLFSRGITVKLILPALPVRMTVFPQPCQQNMYIVKLEFLANLVDEKWHWSVIFICFSLTMSKVEHLFLFICLRVSHISFSLKTI